MVKDAQLQAILRRHDFGLFERRIIISIIKEASYIKLPDHKTNKESLRLTRKEYNEAWAAGVLHYEQTTPADKRNQVDLINSAADHVRERQLTKAVEGM